MAKEARELAKFLEDRGFQRDNLVGQLNKLAEQLEAQGFSVIPPEPSPRERIEVDSSEFESYYGRIIQGLSDLSNINLPQKLQEADMRELGRQFNEKVGAELPDNLPLEGILLAIDGKKEIIINRDIKKTFYQSLQSLQRAGNIDIGNIRDKYKSENELVSVRGMSLERAAFIFNAFKPNVVQ